MSFLSEVQLRTVQFCAERNLWLLASGVYDLFPERPRVTSIQPSLFWPAEWPNAKYHGVYLFFADTPGEPEFLYVGKTSGKTMCLRTRLNGYVDMGVFRTTGQCVLLDEWHGRKSPWLVEPRYLVTIALETDELSGICPAAESLELHLRRELSPSQNIL